MTTRNSSLEKPISNHPCRRTEPRATIAGEPLSPGELRNIDGYWRASLSPTRSVE
jgi:hypothetical protein